MRSGPREKGREVLFFFGLRFLGLKLCPIQDRLCSRRPSRRCQNRDCLGRGRRSVLRLGERSESSPDSMITSPRSTTEVPSSTGSGICPCNRLYGQFPSTLPMIPFSCTSTPSLDCRSAGLFPVGRCPEHCHSLPPKPIGGSVASSRLEEVPLSPLI
jgi:hypothetical protein